MKKKIFSLLFIISLFFPLLTARAGFFPNDANTIYYELEGVGQAVLLSAKLRTILGATIQQSGTASDSYVRCGTQILFKNYAKDLNFSPVHYLCNDIISINKTGNDSASFKITYVDYNLASSTSDTIYTPATTIYASSTPMLFSNNIENISYIATTTTTNAGINITQGTYFIPFILFKFILAILAMTIFVIVLLLLFKSKKHDA